MHRRTYGRAVLAAALLAVVLAVPAAATRSDPPPGPPGAAAPLFSWSMPPGFGHRLDSEGRIVETRPDQVRRGPWPVNLRVGDRFCDPDANYEWRVDGEVVSPKAVGRCRFQYAFPHLGSYTVELRTTLGGVVLFKRKAVDVRNLLIVSLGDSVASGESVPDVPDFEEALWQSARCHRSARAGPAKAAKMIEDDDPHSSVTFVHLACSGATLPKGLIGPYDGVESPGNEPPLEPQARILNRIAAVRPVAAVLLSVGANDVHFGEVVRFCATEDNCFAQQFPISEPAGGRPGAAAGEKSQTTAEAVEAGLASLPESYGKLAQQLDNHVPAAAVHIVEYFDPTRDENGLTCDGILVGVSDTELVEAQSRMLGPLNEAVAAAARANGWDEVTGVASAFRDHGYCAGAKSWVTRLTDSATSLGGTLRGRFLGTLHPNEAGQIAIGNRIAAALERDLFPQRTFPARPDPVVEQEGGPTIDLGAAWDWFWNVLGTTVLLLLGIAVGVVLVSRCFWKPPRRAPLADLARTARPLLLPVLVVLAVGTIRFAAPVQIAVLALIVLVGWRFVLRPSAGESEGELKRELSTVVKHLAAAIVLVLAVLGLLLVAPSLRSSPYFETTGNVPSALLLSAIVLWICALGLRLASYASSRLRSLITLAVAGALIFLGAALGVLPGNENPGEAIPAVVGILAGAAVGLLALEILLDAVTPVAGGGYVTPEPQPRGPRGWLFRLRGGGISGPRVKRLRALGLSAAVLASAVLAIATVVGLIAAAERAGPRVAPDDASVEARAGGALAPDADDLTIARRYAPVLTLTKNDPWSPIPVDTYLDEAWLSGPKIEEPTQGVKLGREFPKAERCPPGQAHCYTISIRCDSGEDACAHRSPIERQQGRLYREGATYLRVLRRSRPAERPYFPERGPFRHELGYLLQYWYFYYYDEWKAPVFAGLLNQRHEGDWEVVTIGLEAERKPLFVAYSAHCAGSWLPWHEVEVTTMLPGPRVHPLVAVAEGSHANYPDPGQSRTPDPAHCQGLPDGVATALSYASNIRDKTEYGWLWYPAPDGWLMADEKEPPMNFQGTWGAKEQTTLENFNSHQLAAGHGPLTPSLQEPWIDPVDAIFCGRYTPRECDRDEAAPG
jgi:lysophospholipase L1-like esterase